MPVFTLRLDFVGSLALIGLSKVRETVTFSGFPLLEELGERICGVYVCNIETGKTLGFIRFEGDVQKTFAVKIRHNTKFSELLEKSDERLNNTFVIPNEALKDVKKIKQAEGGRFKI